MKFELTTELSNQIVFGMENQEDIFLFDSQSLDLVTEAEALEHEGDTNPTEERFLPLPEWRSVDGFNLMENFVANLRNPVAREELRVILKNGRSVFRQFKNALRERPDIERLWFRYRQREMNQRVINWYNDYRELWGLEPYSAVEHDGGRDDLVYSDFEFRVAAAFESALLARWDAVLLDEWCPSGDAADREYFRLVSRQGLPAPATVPESRAIVATSPDGDIAGFLWSFEQQAAGRRYGRIVQLGIQSEFRGIGIASALLRWYQREAAERGLWMVLFDLPANADFLTANLKSMGFVPQCSRWQLNLPQT
jgi:ribosomal protein S18 acetylase RimI-like enzyme